MVRITVWCGLVLLVAGCLSTRTETWQANQFEQLQASWRYYRWSSPPLPDRGDDDAMPIIDRALRAQLDSTLAARGYLKDPGLAQFAVDYRVGGDAVVGLPGVLSPTDVAERIFAGPNAEYEVSSQFYTHRTLGYHEFGHLKLSFYDIGSKRIVWESRASRLIDYPNADPARVAAGVTAATKKLLQDFPGVIR